MGFSEIYSVLYNAFVNSKGREPTVAERRGIAKCAKSPQFIRQMQRLAGKGAVDVTIEGNKVRLSVVKNENPDEQAFSA